LVVVVVVVDLITAQILHLLVIWMARMEYPSQQV
jgi:hypothetical protein